MKRHPLGWCEPGPGSRTKPGSAGIAPPRAEGGMHLHSPPGLGSPGAPQLRGSARRLRILLEAILSPPLLPSLPPL